MHIQRIIVFGNIEYVKGEIDELSKHTIIQEVPDLPGDKAIARFKELAAKHTYDAIAFFSHPRISFDSSVFGPFLPSLRLVCAQGAGFDYVDIDFFTRNGIIFANSPNSVADPTATTATMLILQTVRAATEAEKSVRQGHWSYNLGRTPDVRDLVVGIIGMGTIGKLVRSKVEPLGFRVIYFNRRRLPPSEEGNAKYVTFEELIRTADVISLHTPLTPETRHMLSDAEFDMMKYGVFIVNTSRGAVIDEEALVRALKSKKVLRAGLDVFEHEPNPHPYLLQSERVTVLPHWAAATTRLQVDREYEILGNLKQWLATGKPNTPVNEPLPK